MLKKTLISLLFLLIIIQIQSQTHDFGFAKNNEISISTKEDSLLLYSWAGGMNSMQFAKIDLDFDGIQDLVAFDVHGRRLLPFLNKARNANEINYIYSPEYIKLFPNDIYGVFHLIDFNKDGKKDIFTYKNAGIKVYKNISDSILKFETFTEQVTSIYYENYINLFCTEGDYIIIQDMDDDGDVDILAFWSLGKYIDFHKNQSMEKYGNCEHLDFKLSERCWGYFSESGEGNEITLHDDCNNTKNNKEHRHTGSSMLLFDENGSGLNDLILGDMDYPNLVLLTNGGTQDSAHMVAVDMLFPSYDVPISLYSMPCPIFLDIDNDSVKDLIVSPLDLAYTKSENINSVWWYKNFGTNTHPDFRLQTKSLFQDQMLDFGSGAYPVLFDIDNDGLLDLFVGNYGYFDTAELINGILKCTYVASIAYLKNIGTITNPSFQFITDDLGKFRDSAYTSLIPTFGDINGDGLADMIVGCSDGSLLYMENNTINEELSFTTAVIDFQNIDVGEFAAPQLFDINKDSLLDLIIGDRKGKLSYFKNSGTSSQAVFTWISDNFGNVDVRDYDDSYFGYATPCFFRTPENETRLFVGAENGYILYYKDIDNNLNGSFTLIDSMFYVQNNMRFPIREGHRTAISCGFIDNDSFLDLIIGNFAGGLSYYKGINPPPISIGIKELKKQNKTEEIHIYPNPTQDNLHIKSETLNIIQIEVIDLFGRKLKSFQLENTFTEIKLSDLKQGMYFLFITTEDKHIAIRKIIKMIK
ncbi:MAG: T9SS type A sorting domain-containing protein [Bacteroidales bacterium]|jgi:hypothetical protein|nr:T9SS type A sorting domain-containing protein [Bacteroidales bacterium]